MDKLEVFHTPFSVKWEARISAGTRFEKTGGIPQIIPQCGIFFALIPQSVVKKRNSCYNRAMNAPDFERVEALYQKNKEKFNAFYRLLIEYNARYNLTAITQEKDVLYKHFYDSLAGEAYICENASVVEVGSGAGFPSIPLKIARDDLSFALVESTGKKCDFLNVCIRELGLKNTQVINSRAEDLGKTPAFREQFDVCCARAVAALPTLVEYCLPFVKVGGSFLAYKGEAEEELKNAKRAIALLGGGEAEHARFELPENYGTRTLVRIPKIKNTPAIYPRGNGKERSKPL